MENWTDVIGYEGIYRINNSGKLLALSILRNGKNGFQKRYNEKILKGCVNTVGYLCYDLKKDGVRKNIKAHHLVGHHFVSGYKKGLVINHKDGNKENNYFTNLEWITQKENSIHAFKLRLIVRKGFDVLNTETGIFYESIGDAFRTGLIKYSFSQFKKQIRGMIENTSQFVRV